MTNEQLIKFWKRLALKEYRNKGYDEGMLRFYVEAYISRRENEYRQLQAEQNLNKLERSLLNR